jgi:hypothetical protein
MKPTVSLESPHAGRSRVGASNPTYTTLFLRNEDDRHYDLPREEEPLLVRGRQVMLGGKRFRGALDLFWSFSSQLVD